MRDVALLAFVHAGALCFLQCIARALLALFSCACFTWQWGAALANLHSDQVRVCPKVWEGLEALLGFRVP